MVFYLFVAFSELLISSFLKKALIVFLVFTMLSVVCGSTHGYIWIVDKVALKLSNEATQVHTCSSGQIQDSSILILS